VNWTARVRAITEAEWHAGQVVNLSVSGVLLQLQREYDIGERVEVEIDFRTQPACTSIVAGIGWVVREDGNDPRAAAIHFDLGCRLKFVDS
jgi:hypothetical protein